MAGIKVTPEGKTVEISGNGQVQIQSLKKIIGSILLENGNTHEWVCNLPPAGTQAYNIFLQPGNYILSYREANGKSALYSYSKRFTVKERNFDTLNL